MITTEQKPPTDAQDAAAEKSLQAILNTRQIEFYEPYPKQKEFHRIGAGYDDNGVPIRERLLCAANQVGKTMCASMETAYHMTGEYPSWWGGIRFAEPIAMWAGSTTSQTTRDTVQRLLLGNPGNWGTGSIPKASFTTSGIKKAVHGVSDAVESIMVKHASGGTSRLTLKSYDQGRERWQGETLNFVWFDEEPNMDVYTEGLTRTNATNGVAMTTFTPLKGMSEVVKRFIVDKMPGTAVVNMTLDDAAHYTPTQRLAIEATYPEHERKARAKGIPVLGSGMIFPVEEELIRELAFALPPHWPRIVGLDLGYDHPTAATWMAWDRDTDTVHVYDCYRVRQAPPVIHAAAIKSKGAWIPVSWPHDGYQHDKGSSCEQLAKQYRDLGVNMLPVKATHAPTPGRGKSHLEGSGGFGREAGLMRLLDRMHTGRFKVASHLNDWWEEFRLYHRKDGQVVAVGDDLMSATRYGEMMLRKAKVQALTRQKATPGYHPTDVGMGMLG